MESIEYSWKWVTADELLSHGPCELLYAHLVVSAADAVTYLYDGENANGTKIVTLESVPITGLDFRPAKPVYCRQGLYVDKGTNVTGVFVQWRELGHKAG